MKWQGGIKGKEESHRIRRGEIENNVKAHGELICLFMEYLVLKNYFEVY